MDPHIPYYPPVRYTPDRPIPRRTWNLALDRKRVLNARKKKKTLGPRRLRSIRRLYDAEVQWVDNAIGSILARMKTLGVYDDALIVLLSDHGEEFFEHGGFEHGHSLHDEIVRVPLVVKLPAGTPLSGGSSLFSITDGGHVHGDRHEVVGTRAVMPTILDICHLAQPDPAVAPLSLVPHLGIRRVPVEPGAVFARGVRYGEDVESVIFEGFKYIQCEDTGEAWLYDIERDPGEQTSVLRDHPGMADRAVKLLEAHEHECARRAASYGIGAGDELTLDEDTVEELRALGYLE
jgi:arylsulfatase A-like enzyme